jgi:mono/diheme cytochrome c family protein
LNTGELTPEDIVDYVRYGSGAMPAFDEDDLSNQQLDQLVGYIQGLAAGLAGVPREALICGQ